MYVGPLGAIYFIVVAAAIGIIGILALSIVAFPVCLVRARGNPSHAARMEYGFVVGHPWLAIGFAIAVVVGWSVLFGPSHTPDGRPTADEWTVERISGSTPQAFDSDRAAFGFACNTTLVDDGFILRSSEGYEEYVRDGREACRGHYSGEWRSGAQEG